MIPVTSVKVEWAEGDGKLDGKVFPSLASTFRAIQENQGQGPNLGYYKNKLHIEWKDGEKLTHRFDYGDKDSAGNLVTLSRDVEAAVKFVCGHRPSHMTPESYARMMEAYGVTPEQLAENIRFLATHEFN